MDFDFSVFLRTLRDSVVNHGLRRRSTLPFRDVARSPFRIFFRSQFLGRFAFPDFFQKRDAPTATRSRAATFREQTGHGRRMEADVLLEFPTRDAKAQTDVVVVVHEWIIPRQKMIARKFQKTSRAKLGTARHVIADANYFFGAVIPICVVSVYFSLPVANSYSNNVARY